jgi:CCR4-NOT transcriptional regulation complex NOT5 subunit
MMEMLKEEYEEINKELRGRFRRKTGTDPPPEWLAKNNAPTAIESKFNQNHSTNGNASPGTITAIASTPSNGTSSSNASVPSLSVELSVTAGSVSTRAGLLPNSEE